MKLKYSFSNPNPTPNVLIHVHIPNFDIYSNVGTICLHLVSAIVGDFLHFWSLARHKTKFQISCETCKTARLEEFPIFSVIFKFLARKCR